MNNNPRILYICFVLIILFLSSCDDTTTPQQNSPDYFPLHIGNYWIFNTYELNSSYQKVIGSEKRDSIVAEQELTYDGRTAFLLIVYRDNIILDSLYFSVGSQKVYKLSDNNDIDVQGIEKKWFLIADFERDNTNEWHLYDSIMTDFPFIFNDSPVKATYHQTINQKYESAENILFNNVTHKSLLFQTKYDSRLFFNYRFTADIYPDVVEVNRILQRYIHYTFAQDIGLFKIKQNPYVESIKTDPVTSFSITKVYNGWESDLIDYRIYKDK